MDYSLKSYILEGIIIGTCVATINVYSGEISLYLTGKEDDKKTLWTLGLIVTIIGHVLAETLRGPRILNLLDSYASKVYGVSKSLSGSGLEKMKSVSGSGLNKMKSVSDIGFSTMKKVVADVPNMSPMSPVSLSSAVNNALIFDKIRKLNK